LLRVLIVVGSDTSILEAVVLPLFLTKMRSLANSPLAYFLLDLLKGVVVVIGAVSVW